MNTIKSWNKKEQTIDVDKEESDQDLHCYKLLAHFQVESKLVHVFGRIQ